jgi:hypothetical protein
MSWMDNLDLKAYCDAAFTDGLVSRYSTAEHVVFNVVGGPIYWMTLSTTEAEFINLTPTGCSLIWIKCLLQELGYLNPGQTLFSRILRMLWQLL